MMSTVENSHDSDKYTTVTRPIILCFLPRLQYRLKVWTEGGMNDEVQVQAKRFTPAVTANSCPTRPESKHISSGE